MRQPEGLAIDTQLTSDLLSADFTQAFCSGGPQSVVVLALAGMAIIHRCSPSAITATDPKDQLPYRSHVIVCNQFLALS